jgi:hypothetical protein
MSSTQACLPDVFLLYKPDAIKESSARTVSDGCPPFDKETYGPLWKDAESKLPATIAGLNC